MGFDVYDKDMVTKDDLMGSTEISITDATQMKEGLWIPLQGCKSGELFVSVEIFQPKTGEEIASEEDSLKSEDTEIQEKEARKPAEAEDEAANAKQEEEARLKAEAEAAQANQEEEARLKAEAEAALAKQEEEARLKAEAEAAKAKQEEEARLKAEAEAEKAKQEEEARLKKAKQEEEARLKLEAEAA